MKKFCDHLLTIKTEQVAIFVKQPNFNCVNSKHKNYQLGICLHCGEISCCGKSSFCSVKHASSLKHWVIWKLQQRCIYCYSCLLQVGKIFLNSNSNFNRVRMNKAQQIYAKILSLTQLMTYPQKIDWPVEIMKKQENKVNKQVTKQIKVKLAIQNKFSRSVNKTADNFIVKKAQQAIQAYKNNEKLNVLRQKLNANLKNNLLNKEKPNSMIENQSQYAVFGLNNIGNSCYFNSILQCLYSTVEVHQFYKKIAFTDDLNNCFKNFLSNKQKIFSPKLIFSIFSKKQKFLKGIGQQDAFEFYVVFLNILIESSILKQDKGKSSIGNIFKFICVNRLECLQCKRINWKQQQALGLSISLYKSKREKIQMSENNQISQQDDSMFNPLKYQENNCFLNDFFAPEMLARYQCEDCGHCKTFHQQFIKQPPPVLVINFKRFSNFGKKLNTFVEIPVEININQYCMDKGSFIYEIFAGAVHSGSSNFGHYVAYTKRGTKWFYFSDTHAKPTFFTSLKQARPYIIFYRRKIQENSIKQMDKKQGQISKE